MTKPTRRKFIHSGAAIGLSAVAYSRVARAAADGARPVIGFVGCGGRSRGLLTGFRDDAIVAWACDPDEKRATDFQRASGAKQVTGDLRGVLDDQSVDAIVVATPDHWHAPAAIMACEAGKHVYVEKPCSHNFREAGGASRIACYGPFTELDGPDPERIVGPWSQRRRLHLADSLMI